MVLKTFGAMAQTAAARGGDLAARMLQRAVRPQSHAPTAAVDGGHAAVAGEPSALEASTSSQEGLQEHDAAAVAALLADLGRMEGSAGAAARRIAATLTEARAAIDDAAADLDDVRKVLKSGAAGR